MKIPLPWFPLGLCIILPCLERWGSEEASHYLLYLFPFLLFTKGGIPTAGSYLK